MSDLLTLSSILDFTKTASKIIIDGIDSLGTGLENQWANNVVPLEQKYADTADAFASFVEDQAQKTAAAAETALAADDPVAYLYQNLSNSYQSAANTLLDDTLTAKSALDSVLNDWQGKFGSFFQDNKSAFEKAGVLAAGISAGTSIVALYDAIETGNTDELAKNSGEIALGLAGEALGAAVVTLGAGILGVAAIPAAPFVIAGGVIGAFAGSSLGGELGIKTRDYFTNLLGNISYDPNTDPTTATVQTSNTTTGTSSTTVINTDTGVTTRSTYDQTTGQLLLSTTIDSFDNSGTTQTYTNGSVTSETDFSPTGSTTRTYDPITHLNTGVDNLYADGSSTSIRYDGSGNIVSNTSIDASGAVTQSVTHADGSVTTQYPDGRTSTLVQNGDGSHTVTTNGPNGTEIASYDSNNRLVSDAISHADGSDTVNQYQNGTLTDSTVTNGDGSGIKTHYNSDGSRTVTEVGSDGSSTATSYNPDGSINHLVVTDADGTQNSTNYGYHPSGTVYNADGTHTVTYYAADGTRTEDTFTATSSLIKTVHASPDGSSVTRSWDATSGRQTQVIYVSADGTYDEVDNYSDGSTFEKISNPDGSGSNIFKNANGNVTSEADINADGSDHSVAYNADGKLVSQTTFSTDGIYTADFYTYNDSGILIAENHTHADGSTDSKAYDTNGTLVSQTSISVNSGGYNATDSYSYYASGVLAAESHTQFDGSRQSTSYFNDGTVSSNSVIQANGAADITTYYQGGQIEQKTHYNADGSGSETFYHADGTTTGPQTFGPTGTSPYYHPNLPNPNYIQPGSSKTVTNSDGSSTTYTYNAGSHVSSDTTVYADGSTMTRHYYGDGAYSSVAATYVGNETGQTFTASGYFEQGFKVIGSAVLKSSPNGTVYYPFGTATGLNITYTPSGAMASFSFTLNDGSTDTITYYPQGTVASENLTTASGNQEFVALYPDGDIKQILNNQSSTRADTTQTNPDGSTLNTSYFPNGQVKQSSLTGLPDHSILTYTGKADGSGVTTTSNADGSNIVSIKNAWGDVTTTNYDANGVKLSDTWQRADGTTGSDTFSTNGAGTSRVDLGNGQSALTVSDGLGDSTTNDYNALGIKLSDAWTKADGSSGTDVFGGDGTSSGTVQLASGNSYSYSLDALGNATYAYHFGGTGNLEIARQGKGVNTLSFNQGVNLSDLNITAVFGSDGQPALQIDTGNGKTLIIDGGLDGAVGQFSFADGTSLTLGQLMAWGDTTPVTLAGAQGNLIFSAAGGQTLTGGTGNDTIYAWNGNNTLISGTGTETLVGGSGNDTFVVNNSVDVVEAGSTGNTVLSSVDYSLADNAQTVQNLTMTGSADLTGTGNALDNIITANAGNDVLAGGGGHDTLIGGTGVDTFRLGIDTGQETLIDSSSQGAVIQLEAGLSLSNLTATQQGNDLLLGVTGSTPTMLIQGYFTNPQTIWTITDSTGHTTTPQGVIDATTANPLQSHIAQLESDFMAQARAGIVQSSVSNGYTQQADGSYFSGIHYAAPVGVINAQGHLIDVQHEVTYLNGGTASFSSQATFVPFDYQNEVSSTSVSIQQTETTLDAPIINLDSSLTDDVSQVKWAPVGEFTPLYSEDSLYVPTFTQSVPVADAQGNVIGTDTQTIYNNGIIYVETASFAGTNGSSSPILLSDPANLTTTGASPQATPVGVVQHNVTDLIQQVYISDGDHTVNAGQWTVVNGGAGSDVINNAGFVYTGAGNDTINNADVVYAGTGNNLIINAVTAYGGSGNDTMIGGQTLIAGTGNGTIIGQGSSNIVIDPATVSTDIVGAGAGNNDNSFNLLDAYYQNQGYYSNSYDPNSWDNRYQYAGQYALSNGEGFNGFGDAQTALDYAQSQYGDATLQDAIDAGHVDYIEPLPVLAVLPGNSSITPSSYYTNVNTQVVDLSSYDIAALESFIAQWAIPVSKLTFDAGVSASDLQFSWGQTNASLSSNPADPKSLYTTLNISWGTNQNVQVIIPHADDPIGSGIHEFDFADGTTLSLADMIAMAPPAPDFDPEFFQFSAGMGQQTIAFGDYHGISFANGIQTTDIKAKMDGNDLVLSADAGQDSLRITDWQTLQSATGPQLLFKFGNDTVLSESDIDALINTVEDGSAGNQILNGITGVPTTFIAGPNDTLNGGSNNDTYVYNLGSGVVHINDLGGGTLKFGTGITPDMISLGVGSFMLRVGSNGDTIHIENFNPSDVLGSGTVQNFQFDDGTVLTYDQLVQQGFDIYDTSGNDTLTGTNLDNRIYSTTGNDVLIASGANDTLYGGTGNDTLQAGSGYEFLVGGTGNDTFTINRGDLNVTIDDSEKTQASSPSHDKLEILDGGSFGDISIQAYGADTRITSYAGTNTLQDAVVIKNFNLGYMGAQAPITQFDFSDGSYETYSDDGAGNIYLGGHYATSATRDIFILGKQGSVAGASFENYSNGAFYTGNYNTNSTAISTRFDSTDGSYVTYTDDGIGDITVVKYNAQGQETTNEWVKSDGTLGHDEIDAVTSAQIKTLGNQGGSLVASTGSDTLTSGSGNDTLIGGNGTNIFDVQNFGNGNVVTVEDPAKGFSAGQQEDILNFSAGYYSATASDLSFSQQKDGLVVDTNDGVAVLLDNFYLGQMGANAPISEFDFADGTKTLYIDDGRGDYVFDNIDAHGNIVSGNIYFADGSKTSFTELNSGYASVNSVDANGDPLPSGQPRFLSFAQADGSSVVYADDGSGDISFTNFNAQGQKISEQYWNGATGAYGYSGYAGEITYDPTNGAALNETNPGNSLHVFGIHGSLVGDGIGNDTLTAGSGFYNRDTLVGGTGQNTFIIGNNSFANIDDSAKSSSGNSNGDILILNANSNTYATPLYLSSNATSTRISAGNAGVNLLHFNAGYEGTSFPIGQIELSDGGRITYSDDGQGDYEFDLYDSQGLKRSDGWGQASGRTGTDLYDGSGALIYDRFDDGNGNGGQDYYGYEGTYGQERYYADNSYNESYYDAAGDTWGDYQSSGSNYSYSWSNYLIGNGATQSTADYNYFDGSYLDYTTVTNADGSYQQTWNKSDGSNGSRNYVASSGEQSGSDSEAGAAYSYTWDNTILSGGATESQYVYTYTDGSTYSTDTVSETDGSYQQTWNKSDGSYGSRNYVASTGEQSGSDAEAGAAYSYTWDNTLLSGGTTESKYVYTYTDGSTYSTDTVSDADGSYQQTWAKSDGSYGSRNYVAAAGEQSGSDAEAGAAYRYSWDNTLLAAGATESKYLYTYTNGSTYATDTVSETDGSYQQTWTKSDGSNGSRNYVASTGEQSGSDAEAGAAYSYTWDNTILSGGATESRYVYTYTDASTYSTDTISSVDGSYQQSWNKSDGSYGSRNYVAATGEQSGSDAEAGAAYRYTWDNTLLSAGATESKYVYTYTNGSTYSTDTVSDPNGSYQQSWSKSDGSHGTRNFDAATGEQSASDAEAGAAYSYTADNTNLPGGATESKYVYTYTDGSTYATDTVSDSDGSYQQTWDKSDGSHGTRNYVASTGEQSGSDAEAGAAYSYSWDNTLLAAGANESKYLYTYSDGSTYATDTVSDADGSYQQTWVKNDGSHGSRNYVASTGEQSGNDAEAGAAYSYTWDNTNLSGGTTESKYVYTYTDSSTYSTDTISNADGSYQQTWSKSDGSFGSRNYVAATGEQSGSDAEAGAAYSYTWDNTNLSGGATESKYVYTFTDASTYRTDTVSNTDGSYQQAWVKSDGTAGSTSVNGSGVITGDSFVHADGTQGVDASGNQLRIGSASADALYGGSGANLLIGGAGNDAIQFGSGENLLAFDKGDGQDTVYANAGANNGLSLGGNFAYSDLSLEKNGNDLILDVGSSDAITFKDWYASVANQNLVTLQAITAATSSYAPGSSDVTANAKVETFDFQQIVNEFNTALAGNTSLNAWSVTNALLDAHLASSDTAALGGDLAYDYGSGGNLTGFNVASAQTVAANSNFVNAPQALHPWSGGGVAQLR